MLELLTIHYSPWSEKARWALDHLNVPYKNTDYIPMLGEIALRRRLGRWRGKISVPMLFDGESVVSDSYAIAEHVEKKYCKTRSLFVAAHLDEIRRWNQKSETALAAGRAISSQRVLDDPAARREAMPPMPKLLAGPLTKPLTRLGVAFLRRKYGYGDRLDGEQARLRASLESLRKALADGRQYLVGNSFSYADIGMAVALQFVRPVTDEYIKLGPASRKAWTDNELSQEFSDLIQWRDQVYETHRRP